LHLCSTLYCKDTYYREVIAFSLCLISNLFKTGVVSGRLNRRLIVSDPLPGEGHTTKAKGLAVKLSSSIGSGFLPFRSKAGWFDCRWMHF